MTVTVTLATPEITPDEPGRVSVAVGWRYLVGFLALTILCGTSHEFAHHFAGAAACGGFGTKTFNSFDLLPGCGLPAQVFANLAGPALTFGLMWWGVWLLYRPEAARRRLGIALVFANFPVNRLFFVLIYANDEDYVRRLLLPHSGLAHWLAVALVWLVALPPVVLAWRALGNRPRWAWGVGFFLLPFAFVVAFAGLFLEEFLLLRHRVLATGVLGVPWLIVLTEIVSLALYAVFRPSLTAATTAGRESPPSPVASPLVG